MRHRMSGRKLSRTSAHRTALFRNLAAGLFQHGQITTTLPKAKAVQPFVEKLITLAKRGDLHARREAIAKLQDRDLIHVIKGGAEDEEVEDKTLIQKLFDEIGPKYADRPGGYTRIVRLATYRIGDGSDLVVLQLVGDEEGPNVSGRSSRRRSKQDGRTAFAAKLRKGAGGVAASAATEDSEEAVDEPTAEESPTAVAEESATNEQAEASQPDTDASEATDETKKD